MFPHRHYIRWGETAGLFPSRHFSPHVYQRLNADLLADDKNDLLARPLFNYLKVGQCQNRLCLEPAQELEYRQVLTPNTIEVSNRFAVVVHIYYPELWPEIQRTVMRSGMDLDWYITITEQGESSRCVLEKIQTDLPSAHVWLMPNHGRDIYPWLYLVNRGVLDSYDGVCKIHTKKSPHLHHGDQWRHQLFADLLPNNMTRSLVEVFINTPKAGVLTGHEHLFVGDRWWGYNKAKSLELLSRLNISTDGHELRFPSGSMYWIKPEVIEAMKALALQFDDFEEEMGATDGTMAHAFERIVGYLCTHVGMHIQTAYRKVSENP